MMAPTDASNGLTLARSIVAWPYPVWDVSSGPAGTASVPGWCARLPCLAPAWWRVRALAIYDNRICLVLQYGTYDQGLLIDVPWLLGFVLFGGHGLQSVMGELTQPVAQPNTRLSWRRLARSPAPPCRPRLCCPRPAGPQPGGRDCHRRRLDVLFLLVGCCPRRAGPAGGGAVRALAALARHDGLTGMPPRTWDSELRWRWTGPGATACRCWWRCSTWTTARGSTTGTAPGRDRALKSPRGWRQLLRSTDLLCRYGGEEFSVLLPGATTEHAAEILERLREVTPQGQTFSAGLTCWDGQEVSEELVARADRALYAAKAAGRDRVIVDSHPAAAGDHHVATAQHR